MKSVFPTVIMACILISGACTKTKTNTEFTDAPIGSTTILKMGTITQQNAPGTPPTSGSVAIVQDSKSNQFLELGADFTSGFATGTVTIYFAKSNEEINAQRNGGSTAGNVLAIGFVRTAGKQYIKLTTQGSFSPFSFVVLYCETAEVNFGSASLN